MAFNSQSPVGMVAGRVLGLQYCRQHARNLCGTPAHTALNQAAFYRRPTRNPTGLDQPLAGSRRL